MFPSADTHVARVRHDSGNIACQKIFAFANADDERTAAPRADHYVGKFRGNDCDAKRADNFFHRTPHCFDKQRARFAIRFVWRMSVLANPN